MTGHVLSILIKKYRERSLQRKRNIKIHNTIIFCIVDFYPSVIEENRCNKDITTFNKDITTRLENFVRSNTCL